jgi:hypothetical protein
MEEASGAAVLWLLFGIFVIAGIVIVNVRAVSYFGIS